MIFREKLRDEAKAIALTTAYFAACFGVLLLLKMLILAEYQIDSQAYQWRWSER